MRLNRNGLTNETLARLIPIRILVFIISASTYKLRNGSSYASTGGTPLRSYSLRFNPEIPIFTFRDFNWSYTNTSCNKILMHKGVVFERTSVHFTEFIIAFSPCCRKHLRQIRNSSYSRSHDSFPYIWAIIGHI